MTLEIAAYLGMGAVLLFGLVALLFAFLANKKEDNRVHGHHA
jgi:hypothetical protein